MASGGPKKSCVRWGQICKGAILRGEMAELIEMPFGMWTWVVPRKHVLDGGAHSRNLANAINPSMCSGDVAFLSNFSDHLLLSLVLSFTALTG